MVLGGEVPDVTLLSLSFEEEGAVFCKCTAHLMLGSIIHMTVYGVGFGQHTACAAVHDSLESYLLLSWREVSGEKTGVTNPLVWD